MGLFGSKQVSPLQEEKPVRVKKAENRFRFDGDMPRKGEQIGRYRRSLSLSNMDYRSKYWDVGGLTLRRKLPQPINIKKYYADQAYIATELLPEVIVKKLPEIPVKNKDPHKRKPERFGDELGLLTPPSYIPSVLHVKQLLETPIVAQAQVKRLKEKEKIFRSDYEAYSMFLWRAELPNNRPPENGGNQYNFREHEDFIKQCNWYRTSAERCFKSMKETRDRIFYIETVTPLIKNAVENCFKIVTNQANLSEEDTNLILTNLWNLTTSDRLNIYGKLKMMIFQSKWDWDYKGNTSKTKLALMANYRDEVKKQKVKVRTEANCANAKCCKGTCKQDGKVCHRERFYNFKDGEIIMKVLYGKCTIVLPKKVLLEHAEIKEDPYDLLSLRDPEAMLALALPKDEILKRNEPVIANLLHEMTDSTQLLKKYTYELLSSFHCVRRNIQNAGNMNKINPGGQNEIIQVPLPFLSSFYFELLRAILKETEDLFAILPKTIDIYPGAVKNIYVDEYGDEDDIQTILDEMKPPPKYTYRPKYFRDLRDTAVDTWTYFKDTVTDEP